MSNKIDENTLKDIENEFEEWSNFLNIGIGLLSFNFAIASDASHHPIIFSILSFFIIFTTFEKGKKYFPKRIYELRKKQLIGIDEIIWIGMEKKYFGIKNFLLTTNIFLIGIISLSIVMLTNIFQF